MLSFFTEYFMHKTTIIIFFIMLAAFTFAQTEENFNVALNITGDGIVITKYTGTAAHVVIPAIIQGFPVREIGERAFGGGLLDQNHTIISVVIPQGVTKIGKSAFQYAKNLSSLTIPEGVTVIDAWAFSSTGLTEILLPQSLTEISNDVFMYCSSLATVMLPAKLIKIGSQAFWGCTALTNITLPASIKEISYGVFANCSNLATVTIPESVGKIVFESPIIYGIKLSDYTFEKCPKLTLASQAVLRRVGYTGTF